MGVQISNSTREFETRREPEVKRLITQYKADGYLFKEVWEETVTNRTYVKTGHSVDPNMLAHRDAALAIPYIWQDGWLKASYDAYWPWTQSDTDVTDETSEFITGWEIEFFDDGACTATINTQELDVALSKTQTLKPEKLNRSPK